MRTQIVLVGAGVACLGSLLIFQFDGLSWKSSVKHALAHVLVKQVPAPASAGGGRFHGEERFIYVMGGAHEELKARFAEAAKLYKQGLARKILLKSEDMLLEYSPALGRNLKHDEWALKLLMRLDVAEKDIEFLVVEGRFLGTFNEAKALSRIAAQREFETLLVVSSDYHTARVWYIFSKFIRAAKKNTAMYVYGVSEHHGGYLLLTEFIKLVCYRVFL